MRPSVFAGAKNVLHFLDYVPHKYKIGPWSPITHLTVLTYVAFVLLSAPFAFEHYVIATPSINENTFLLLQSFRICGMAYGLSVATTTFLKMGIWPFASYTFTSWNLMTIRLLFAFLGGCGSTYFQILADTVQFPALVGCTITVIVWWGVLVPVIDTLLRRNADRRAYFWEINQSFMLVSVHLLNLPIIATEFLLSARPLTFFDLWVAFFVALMYCLFYLNVLVPQGLHFYIIFSPQTGLSVISYGTIIVTYYAAYTGWNAAMDWALHP